MSIDFIPTRGSSGKKNIEQKVQVVTYESYKSKVSKNPDVIKSESSNEDQSKEFNIRQAKHEIVKFGMSGFTAKRKEEAKIQLAVKLGAKPPKNKFKNYKILLAEKKKEQERESRRNKFQQLGKNSLGKSIAKGKSFDRKRKKEKGGLLDIYGKVTKASKS